MLGLMENGFVRHAVVKSPGDIEYVIYDARGRFNLDCLPGARDGVEFGKPFSYDWPYRLKPITEDELRAFGPINERMISMARRMAEVLWPDLLWKESHVLKFVPSPTSSKLSRGSTGSGFTLHSQRLVQCLYPTWVTKTDTNSLSQMMDVRMPSDAISLSIKKVRNKIQRPTRERRPFCSLPHQIRTAPFLFFFGVDEV